jgi:hypothetical protein
VKDNLLLYLANEILRGFGIETNMLPKEERFIALWKKCSSRGMELNACSMDRSITKALQEAECS